MNIKSDRQYAYGCLDNLPGVMSANLEAPIDYSDLVYFGPRSESLTEFKNYGVLKVQGAGQIARGNAVIRRSSQAALAVAKSGVRPNSLQHSTTK